jgi:hypothetical protein
MTTRHANLKKSDARIAVLVQALAAGNTRRTSASQAGVSHETFYRWFRDDVTFHDAVEKAEADAEARAVAIVVRAAVGGTWQAAAWWLERRRQDTYALHPKMELSGPGGGPIQTEEVGLDDHERVALRKAIDAELAKVPTE